MANDNEATRSTLNDLIETCKDGEEGFRSGAEKLKQREVHLLFLELSQQRSRFAGELQAEVTNMGGEPAKSGTTAGAIHRGWIGLKSAVTGDSDHAILEEAERGEDAAVKNYREALGKKLPDYIQEIVLRQFREIEQAHRTVRELRDTSREPSTRPMAGRSK